MSSTTPAGCQVGLKQKSRDLGGSRLWDLTGVYWLSVAMSTPDIMSCRSPLRYLLVQPYCDLGQFAVVEHDV